MPQNQTVKERKAFRVVRYYIRYPKHSISRNITRFLTIIALFLGTSCATYRPLPLTSEAIDARLQPPDPAALRVLAAQIKHPLLPPLELEPNQGLTPDSAAILTVLLNPSLRAIRDQKAVARAQLLEAGLLPNPELIYSLDVPTGGSTTGRVTAYGLGLDWDVTSLLSRASRMEAAEKHEKAVDLQIAWQEWQVAQAAKGAVFQLLSLQKQIELVQQVSQRLTDDVISLQKAVEQGAMTEGALNTAQIANRHARENLLDLEKRAAQQRLQLERLLGLPAGSRIRLNQDIRLPSRVALSDEKLLYEGLEQRRLDLIALRLGYDSQEAAVRTAIMEQFPRIRIGPTISRDTDNVKTTGFSVNIEMPFLDRRQGRIAHERATRQTLFDEYAGRLFEARKDIEQLMSGLGFLAEQVVAAQATEADLGRMTGNYRDALAAGQIEAPLYYAVLEDFVRAQVRVFALQGQLAQTKVALELAAGIYQIPEKPDQPPKASSAQSKKVTKP